ncbi:MAG: hypothetical protein D6703_04160 [Zetaproteobacteria bacterium]|nr:MAG: hypothetical protein D6703_04160 [Zetaproteobacteria bacterium]
MRMNRLSNREQNIRNQPMRARLNTWLFDLRAPTGRTVNMILMFLIIASVLLGMAGSVSSFRPWHRLFNRLEIFVTLVFMIEYALRLYSARHPWRYALSIYGIADLLAILPLLLIGQPNTAMRLLRIFRMLKLFRYLRALHLFVSSLRDVYEIMLVVTSSILIIVLIAGNLILVIEPELVSNAFEGCWWALVTMTTVGYGDIVPHSAGGQLLASVLMIIGLTMFAMLTGTISVKIAHTLSYHRECKSCGRKIAQEFIYCPFCGLSQLAQQSSSEDKKISE